MPRGLYSRFDRLSTEEDSRIAIKQEVSDRKVKREPTSNEHVDIETHKSEMDDHSLLWSIPQFPGNQSDDSGDNDSEAAIKDEGQDVVINEENQPTKKRARTTHRPRVTAGYYWDDANVDATIHARELGITELSSGQVGRVVEHGELTGIFDLDPIDSAQNFMVYDGLEILARVEDFEMETAVYELAALHIGQRLHWNHPHDHDLAMSSVPMKGRLAGGFAVKVCPMAEEPAKKRKGPTRKSQI